MRSQLAILLILICLALLVCMTLSLQSRKAGSRHVAQLTGALIFPVIGNIMIILSGEQDLSTVGYYSKEDKVFRIGGDEFVVLMDYPGEENPDSLIADKITLMNEELAKGKERVPGISVSAGIAYGKDATGFLNLFEHADQAMYDQTGREKGVYFLEGESSGKMSGKMLKNIVDI